MTRPTLPPPIEAMAEHALDAMSAKCFLRLVDPLSEAMQDGIKAALTLAHSAGFVLVPVALIQEAAHFLNFHTSGNPLYEPRAAPIIAALRQAAGKGATT